MKVVVEFEEIYILAAKLAFFWLIWQFEHKKQGGSMSDWHIWDLQSLVTKNLPDIFLPSDLDKTQQYSIGPVKQKVMNWRKNYVPFAL